MIKMIKKYFPKYTFVFGNQFAYNFREDYIIIPYTKGWVFESNMADIYYSELGRYDKRVKNLNPYLIALLHEIGHAETEQYATEEKKIDHFRKLMILEHQPRTEMVKRAYMHLPLEAMANDWLLWFVDNYYDRCIYFSSLFNKEMGMH